MSNYYLKAIILNSCSHSLNAKQLIETNNINNKIITIDDHNKDNYKSDIITTFPQIYLERKHRNGSLLLGGYDDLVYIINTFKNQEFNKENVTKFCDKYKWSRKATLRLIELINH